MLMPFDAVYAKIQKPGQQVQVRGIRMIENKTKSLMTRRQNGPLMESQSILYILKIKLTNSQLVTGYN